VTSAMRPLLLLPEMLLFGGGLLVLLGGSFLPRRRQWVARAAASAALLGCAAVAATALAGPAQRAFEGSFAVDTLTGAVRVVAPLATLLVMALAGDEIAGAHRESEICALLLFSTTGTLVLAGGDDLLVVFVGFLLTSIPLYGLIGLSGTGAAAEAAMKTYLVGALFGIILLLGVTVVTGVAGTTAYADLGAALTGAP